MYKYFVSGLLVIALPLVSCDSVNQIENASSNRVIYDKFPITVKGYKGEKTNSVSYTGQIARHTLHESLKKLAGKGNGKSNLALRAQMMAYYDGKEVGRSIISPTSSKDFPVSQSAVDQISKKNNLSDKTYKGVISGMPNQMNGEELLKFWIDKTSGASKGQDKANGYDYPQLISKFIMGAVFYNQVVDGYLDENLEAEKKPNDKPYKAGAAYTGKEHSWDEAFGYFGTPAHTMKLSAKQVYEIAKKGSKSKPKANALKYADYNGDGKVNLFGEMAHSPAYYASSFDKGGKTNYLVNITKAFLDGRNLLADANGEKLTNSQRSKLKKYAAVIEDQWEKSLAEAVFKYAGEVYGDLAKMKVLVENKGDTSKVLKGYIKHWGELKGFSLSLQAGRKKLGETGAKLNRLIGFDPVMPNSSQVSDIDSKGNYVKSQSSGIGEYRLHMLRIQKLMLDKFDVKARSHDKLRDLDSMIKSLGKTGSAEND